MSLRRTIKVATGQDIHNCHACFECDVSPNDEMDIPLGSLIQLALLDDEEALHSQTLWSDTVLEAARCACKRGLDLYAVMHVLREEATRRYEHQNFRRKT